MTITSLLVASVLMAGGALALALYFGCLALLRQAREFSLLAGLLLLASARALTPVIAGIEPIALPIEVFALHRFDGATLLSIGVLYILFLRALYPDDVPSWGVMTTAIVCGFAALAVMFVPDQWLGETLIGAHALMMLVLFGVGGLSVVLMRRWRDGAGWIAVSVLAMVTSVLMDLMLRQQGQEGLADPPGVSGVMSAGSVLFALGHVFLIGTRLNRVYQTSQTLSRHAVALNRTLEQRVTEASREVHATREQLEAILACVPDGVITLTGEGIIDVFGTGAERVFGWRSHEVLGRSIVTLMSPEWGERLVRSLRRFEAEGVLTYTGQGVVEMEGRRRDGGLFPMQCTVTRIDMGGQPVFVASVRDVSAEQSQRQTIDAMQQACESARRDLALVETWGGVGHFVSERTGEGWSTRWSEGFAAVWGWDAAPHPETVEGFLARVHPDDQPSLFAWLDRQDWIFGNRRVRICVRPEEERVLDLSVRRFFDDAGTMARKVGGVRLVSVVAVTDSEGEETMETGLAGGPEGVRNILLVEDVEVNRRVAVTFLEREGYRVEIASTGLEAVEMAGAGDYDLILMDIRLPDVDGVEATRRIRALPDPVRSTVPVLALTANVFGDDLSRYEAAGMSGVVAKPIRMPQFRTVLGGVLTRRRQQAAVATGPNWTSLDLVLDEEFIRDRQLALGVESFAVILDLGRRSSGFAAEELAKCAAADTPSAPDLARAGHKLAGAASNFGFAALYALGRRVETLCEAGNVPEALILGRRAADLRQKTDAALDQWLARAGQG